MPLELESILTICGMLVYKYRTQLDPEDAYQEAFLAIYSAAPEDEALAYTMGERNLIDLLRRSSTRRRRELPEDLWVEPAASPQWMKDPARIVPGLLDIQEFLVEAGPRTQAIVLSRLKDEPISHADRDHLYRQRKRHGHLLRAG
jgi:DNA-directed RNA polymerase specialized sigma24 family protein